jgi:replication factor C subunit 3/5
MKLIILDEADMMTKDAQNALRRGESESHSALATRFAHPAAPLKTDARCAVIEANTKNCRFCIICNYVNKIIPALQSRSGSGLVPCSSAAAAVPTREPARRCTRFRFGPLAPKQMRKRLQEVVERER